MAKVKEVVKKFKMQAPGGTATPAPPIGPALGANGVNPGQFITKFNAATAALKGKVVGVEVTVYSDRTFDFIIKSPPAAVLLKNVKLGIHDLQQQACLLRQLAGAPYEAEARQGGENQEHQCQA